MLYTINLLRLFFEKLIFDGTVKKAGMFENAPHRCNLDEQQQKLEKRRTKNIFEKLYAYLGHDIYIYNHQVCIQFFVLLFPAFLLMFALIASTRGNFERTRFTTTNKRIEHDFKK